jgi:hypothetical protein
MASSQAGGMALHAWSRLSQLVAVRIARHRENARLTSRRRENTI